MTSCVPLVLCVENNQEEKSEGEDEEKEEKKERSCLYSQINGNVRDPVSFYSIRGSIKGK